MSIILDGSTGITSDSSASNPAMTAKGNGSDVEGYIQLNCRVNSHGVKLKSPPHSSGQSYTMVLPDNQVAAEKFLKVKSITGSGATAVGQLEYADVTTNTKITRVGQGSLNGVDAYTYTNLPSGIVQFSFMWYGASLANNTAILFRIGHSGGTQTSGYFVAQAEIGDGTDSVTRNPRSSEIPVQTDSWESSPGVSSGRIDFTQAEGNTWTWKMQNYYFATASGHFVNMLNTGYIALGGVLERAVLFNGSGNFDAGNVYLTYTQIV